jgi:hypothetical protein
MTWWVKKIVVRLRLFAVVFFGDCFLQLAVLRGPQPPGTVDRHFGCRRTRCSAGSVRFVQEERTL